MKSIRRFSLLQLPFNTFSPLQTTVIPFLGTCSSSLLSSFLSLICLLTLFFVFCFRPSISPEASKPPFSTPSVVLETLAPTTSSQFSFVIQTPRMSSQFTCEESQFGEEFFKVCDKAVQQRLKLGNHIALDSTTEGEDLSSLLKDQREDGFFAGNRKRVNLRYEFVVKGKNRYTSSSSSSPSSYSSCFFLYLFLSNVTTFF
jgi:hypothetical protein